MESTIDQLVARTHSPDNDVKVDALTKLRTEFENGVELHDIDVVLAALKASLRTPNQHVATAAMSAIAPFVPLIVSGSHSSTHMPSNASSSSLTGETATLRQVVNAFLAPGGVLDRMGESRDKIRDTARQALVSIATVVHKHGGQPLPLAASAKLSKAQETPMSILERFVREVAFASKTWRVREQIIISLVSIRASCPGFPLKPYVNPLVDALEDSDGTVRDCARESVIQIFTGPTVTDAARADLKKEMVKKGVRKNIQEAILARLLAGAVPSAASSMAASTSEAASGDHGGALSRAANAAESVPPNELAVSRTGAAHPPIRAATAPAGILASDEQPPVPMSTDEGVKAVYVASARDVESEIAEMVPHFEGRETEHNWQQRDKAIAKLRGMLKGGVQLRFPDAYLAGLKAGMLDKSFKALLSLRTTMATNAINFYSELVLTFGVQMDPFLESLLNTLLGMSGYTKRIVAQGTQAAVTTIMENMTCPPRLVLPMLAAQVEDKTVQARQFASGHVRKYIELHGNRQRHQIEAHGGRDTLEKCVKRGLADPNAAVRDQARTAFWAFHAVWPDRATIIMGTLDATGRKQLEKACPDANALKEVAVVVPPPEKPKKTSAAAMIAAARAKQQQIAAAPPTLRHHATSTAHAARAASPPLHSPTRSGTAMRSGSPVGSPSRGRVSPVPSGHTRTRSGSSQPAPPSPPPSPPSPKISRQPTTPVSLPRASVTRPSPQTSRTSPVPSASVRATTQPVHTPARNLFNPHRSTPPRPSTDDEMLKGMSMPDEESSDGSDEGRPHDAVSFSTPYERFGGPLTPVKSAPTTRTNGVGTEHEAFASPPPPSALLPEHVVEDALRARAEQAVSAADRLLELVVDEDDMGHISPIPESLLPGNGPPVRPAPVLKSVSTPIVNASPRPVTPPTNGGNQAKRRVPKRDSDWWRLRASTFELGKSASAPDLANPGQQLRDITVQLEKGLADVAALQRLAALCNKHPVDDEPLSPVNGHGSPVSPVQGDVWADGKVFDKVFAALLQFMESQAAKADAQLLSLGLVVLWEMIENQTPYTNGHESELLSLLFRLRYSNRRMVMEGTTEIRDLLATQVDPVFGLTTAHGCLKAFLAKPLPEGATAEMRSLTLAFGLLALAKFIPNLPAEVIEEELPRLKAILISSLNDSSLIVREAAMVAIIAAQLVLRDETHLFMLLDGLATEKKNLLTYFFDKHGARGTIEGVAAATGSHDRLEKEMRRLDGRMDAARG